MLITFSEILRIMCFLGMYNPGRLILCAPPELLQLLHLNGVTNMLFALCSYEIFSFEGAGVAMGMYNTDESAALPSPVNTLSHTVLPTCYFTCYFPQLRDLQL
jgi:hypothetical protein